MHFIQLSQQIGCLLSYVHLLDCRRTSCTGESAQKLVGSFGQDRDTVARGRKKKGWSGSGRINRDLIGLHRRKGVAPRSKAWTAHVESDSSAGRRIVNGLLNSFHLPEAQRELQGHTQ